MALGRFRVKKLTGERVSRRRQYARWVVGKEDLFSLLRFELITAVAGNMPGAFGLYIRSKLYPLILAGVGANVVFGTGIKLRHPHKIRIGDDAVIDDNCLLDAKGDSNAGIVIGDGAFVGRNSILVCKDGGIELRRKASLSFNCEVFSSNRVVIGEGTMIASYCYIMSGGRYDYESETPFADQDGLPGRPTRIGRSCWLGAKVIVLDGMTVGDRCVIGAGAVVTRSIPDHALALGIPARVIKDLSLGSDAGIGLVVTSRRRRGSHV